jgi:hypothetical protein
MRRGEMDGLDERLISTNERYIKFWFRLNPQNMLYQYIIQDIAVPKERMCDLIQTYDLQELLDKLEIDHAESLKKAGFLTEEAVSITNQLGKAVWKREKERNWSVYSSYRVTEIRIHPDRFFDLMEEDRLGRYIDFYFGYFRFMGIPISQDRNVEKWEII